MLRGRRRECQALDGLLDAVRAGESRALVVHGDAGMGKSALLDHLREQAADCLVERGAGVQSEMELAYAGVHQLCAPLLDRLDRLPDPQRDALRIAFGAMAGPPPDRFVVGLAVLSLFSEAASERPLLCLVDDAQWLDLTSAPVLAFVARRLGAESVGLVFAVRGPAGGPQWAGLPRMSVEGLGDADARALLASVAGAPLDERVRDRILAETRGNPLGLLELPRAPTGLEPAGPLGLAGRIEDSYRRRYEALPADTRRLLLVAAAEPVGEPLLLRRAVGRLGLDFGAAGPATDDGLLELGARVRFRHPLVRSAVYRAASAGDRREAHGALAEATDPDVDPDRRAWHRAQATAGPDEDVAAELERSAGRAQARGGLPAAGAFLQRAAELTLDPVLRAERALAAAHAKQQAGVPEDALELLRVAESGPLDGVQRARLDLLRGQIAFASSDGRDAPALLLRAARALEALDPALARETYLDALGAAVYVGRCAGDVDLLDVARAARAAPAASQPERASDALLDGWALAVTEGYAAGAPALERAVAAFRGPDLDAEAGIRWLWLATHAAHDLLDHDGWDALCGRQLEIARRAGAFAVLPITLTTRVGYLLSSGELAAAASLSEESEAVVDATGSRLPRYAAMAVAAWQGREAEAFALIDAVVADAETRAEGMGLSVAHNATAVLCNALRRYDDALAAATRAAEHPAELGFAILVLPELVEAAVRSGRPEAATAAMRRIAEIAEASGTDWARGLEARCRALLGEDEAPYEEAIDRLGRTRAAVDLARAHLLYGEWLRRRRQRVKAREHLRRAHEALLDMGAAGFARRAEHELQATGETARRDVADDRDELTAQEAQIARLAGEGLSNPEIGARLFISPRTVEYHLGKVFAKLGIASRTQLGASGAEVGGVGRPGR